jgi:hypothetical protein
MTTEAMTPEERWQQEERFITRLLYNLVTTFDAEESHVSVLRSLIKMTLAVSVSKPNRKLTSETLADGEMRMMQLLVAWAETMELTAPPVN